MKKLNGKYLVMVAMPLCVMACKSEPEKLQIDVPQEDESFIYVDTMILRKTDFHKQLVCNGKLSALQKSELAMPSSGVLATLNVKEGQRVGAGTVLASVEDRDKLLDVESAERSMEKAKVSLQDKLIGLGYDGITSSVPKDVMKREEIASGYADAAQSLTQARLRLSDCKLVAPFSGKVADIKGKLHENTSVFCTLIDDSYFDVEFQILEVELATVHVGTEVKVSPFVSQEDEFVGNVTEINPTVDNRGLIKVKAKIKNTSDKLVDGMNVRVIVENIVPDMFVVPKDAVVERDGYHVVFMCKDNRSVWTYVDIAYTNLTSYAITGCEKKSTKIEEGEVLITSGNQNIADDTQVVIKAPEKE